MTMRKFFTLLLLLVLVATSKAQNVIKEPEFIYQSEIVNSDSSTTLLESEQAKITAKAGASMYITGIGKVKTRYQIPGATSKVRVKKAPEIVIISRAPSNNLNPAQVIKIYKLEPKKKYRQVQIGEIGTFSGSSYGGESLNYDVTKYGVSSYKIVLHNLEAGEYGITVLNPLAFGCFGIDE